jgi:p70 ribosomal S6 kinase
MKNNLRIILDYDERSMQTNTTKAVAPVAPVGLPPSQVGSTSPASLPQPLNVAKEVPHKPVASAMSSSYPDPTDPSPLQNPSCKEEDYEFTMGQFDNNSRSNSVDLTNPPRSNPGSPSRRRTGSAEDVRNDVITQEEFNEFKTQAEPVILDGSAADGVQDGVRDGVPGSPARSSSIGGAVEFNMSTSPRSPRLSPRHQAITSPLRSPNRVGYVSSPRMTSLDASQPSLFSLDASSTSPAAPSEQPAASPPRVYVTPADFTLISVIGQGAFGKVLLVRNKQTSQTSAMKIISKRQLKRRPSYISNIAAEREILSKCSSPFCVTMQCSFQTSDKLFIIMEFAAGGELFYHLGKQGLLLESQSAFYVAEIVLALEHLHGLDIIHRDLKPENILLSADGHCLLTDFGLAKMYTTDEEGKLLTICGTSQYMSPEMLAKTGYGKASDWWSLGCITFELLTGYPPFDVKRGEGPKELQKKIMYERIKMPSGATSNACKIIRGLLNRDPAQRLGNAKGSMFQVGGVAQLKGMGFFEQLDWIMLERKAIPPPFDLSVDNDEDLKNIHPEFLEMPVPASLSKMNDEWKPRRCQSETFKGFSFVHKSMVLPSRTVQEEEIYWAGQLPDEDSDPSEAGSAKKEAQGGGDDVPPSSEKKKRPPRKKKKAIAPAAIAGAVPPPPVEIENDEEERTEGGQSEATGEGYFTANQTPADTPMHTPMNNEVAATTTATTAEAEDGANLKSALQAMSINDEDFPSAAPVSTRNAALANREKTIMFITRAPPSKATPVKPTEEKWRPGGGSWRSRQQPDAAATTTTTTTTTNVSPVANASIAASTGWASKAGGRASPMSAAARDWTPAAKWAAPAPVAAPPAPPANPNSWAARAQASAAVPVRSAPSARAGYGRWGDGTSDIAHAPVAEEKKSAAVAAPAMPWLSVAKTTPSHK